MIARETARLIAELVAGTFSRRWYSHHSSGDYSDAGAVYDFLYDHGFPAWLCNAAKRVSSVSSTRPLKEFVMRLHTGESQASVTAGWTWPQREKLGQQCLQQLAEAMLNHLVRSPSQVDRSTQNTITACRGRLELDGFVFKGATLLAPEEDVLDAKEEAGVLEQLYQDLGLADAATAFHHLRLSEQHYLAGKWDDSIGNSRKFLECVLREVALAGSRVHPARPLSEDAADRPVRVRDYLEAVGLLETKEKETVGSIYGLLSETGSHPYMAQSEQARLLRHLALTVSQFVMLRLRGSLKREAPQRGNDEA